jgi:hypothetical protein
MQLTQDEIDHYRDEGYLALSQLTDAADVACLREIYDELFARRIGREDGNAFDLVGADDDDATPAMPQLLDPARYAPALLDTRLLKNATEVGRQLLGEGARCHFAHAICKPPRISPATPWHQDAAYWHPDFDYDSLSIWVPLQEADIGNGCMQFLPRSHVAQDVHPHRSIGDDPRIHGLELEPDAVPDLRSAVACPLPAGGATIHGPYMLHYTGPNTTAGPRRAIILNASLPPTRRGEPRDLYWLRKQRTRRAERARAAKARRNAVETGQ